MQRKIKDYLVISLKGMAMGAADVVPGVSGGTIALITGIYQELINTISSINLDAFNILRKNGIAAAFRAINGAFLSFLILGILISVLSLAKLFHYLLDHEPVLVWSFFFGLIVASILLIGKMVKKWNINTITALITGTIISFGITIISPAHGPDALWYLFLSGMLAFIAMILPGISGSFILLLLGAYQLVLGKVNGLLDGIALGDSTLLTASIIALTVFVLGGITGLLSFSRILKWMFEKYEELTLALLTGFLIGSLNKVWPWKQTLSVWYKHAGTEKEEAFPLIQKNVFPGDYSLVTSADEKLGLITKNPELITAIAFAFIGFMVIYVLERVSGKLQK
jgi:putative membrane protein